MLWGSAEKKKFPMTKKLGAIEAPLFIFKFLQGGFFKVGRDRHEFKNFTKINLWM